MASLSDYWNFFVLAGELSFRSVLRPLLTPALSNPLYMGIWIVVFVYGCELVVPWRKSQPKLREGVWLDLFYTLGYLLLFGALISTPIFQTAQLVFHHALHSAFGVHLPQLVSLGGWPLWSRWALLFLISDFLNYLGHRLLHRSEFLWNFHKVHHSSKRLDILNAVRLHWAEKIFYVFFTYVPLAMIGFEAQQIFVVAFANLFLCLFTHANVRVPLGPLTYVLNNPQLHLWHHAVEVPHNRNVNYGAALSLWDFLLGTAYLPDDRADLEVGFVGMETLPTTLWGQQLYPISGMVAAFRRRWA
jgi:sterol desaturase/sphingolipid hydroxylase (fatty acid hydroxylase superfamily)